MAVNFVRDQIGLPTHVVIDIESWNNFMRFHSEAAYMLSGNTFNNDQPAPPDRIFAVNPNHVFARGAFAGPSKN